MPGLTVYARVDGSFSVWDPARNYWRESELLHVSNSGRLDAFHFSPYTLWNGLEDDEGTTICRGLIEDWQTRQLRESASKRSLFAILRNVLKKLSPPGEVTLEPGDPARVGPDVREIPTLRQPNGDVPIIFVSAGMRRILGLAYLLIWAWHEHRRAREELGQTAETRFVLLFDEVETHLHPKWQREIIRSLLSVITGFGDDEMSVQVLLTTHSPLVLAALEPSFDEDQDKLFHFFFKGAGVELEEEPWAKLGDASQWLTSDVFGLRRAGSSDAEEAMEAAEQYMDGTKAGLPETLNTFKKIDTALRRLLAGDDRWWRRWERFRERQGTHRNGPV